MTPNSGWVEPPNPPAYQPPPMPGQGQAPSTLVCPKCRGAMRTYERNGIHLEQCDSCRGIFLDVGELEALTRMESQIAPVPQHPGQYGPGWGTHGNKHYRKKGFGSLFFSS